MFAPEMADITKSLDQRIVISGNSAAFTEGGHQFLAVETESRTPALAAYSGSLMAGAATAGGIPNHF